MKYDIKDLKKKLKNSLVHIRNWDDIPRSAVTWITLKSPPASTQNKNSSKYLFFLFHKIDFLWKKIFPKEVKVQLLWSTWIDICDILEFKNGTRGVYVDGGITGPLVGLFYNNNNEKWIIRQGDWIIKNKWGRISYMTDDQMKRSNAIKKLNI